MTYCISTSSVTRQSGEGATPSEGGTRLRTPVREQRSHGGVGSKAIPNLFKALYTHFEVERLMQL